MKWAAKQSLGEKWSMTSKRLRSTGLEIGFELELELVFELGFGKVRGISWNFLVL